MKVGDIISIIGSHEMSLFKIFKHTEGWPATSESAWKRVKNETIAEVVKVSSSDMWLWLPTHEMYANTNTGNSRHPWFKKISR